MRLPNTYSELEEFVYSAVRKNFRRNEHTWYLLECKNCGEEYFGYRNSFYCSNKCSSSGEYNGMYGKSNETAIKKIKEKWKDLNSKYNSEEYRKSLSRKDSLNNNWKGGVKEKSIPPYDTYASQLEWVEEIRRCPTNTDILEVRCFKCGKWYTPTRYSVSNRLQYLKGNENYHGEFNFYCSKACKNECSIYGLSADIIAYRDAIKSGNINIGEYQKYKREVYSLSNKNLIKYKYMIKNGNRKRGRNQYHLDHIYSVKDGYFNNIPIEILSSPVNLRMITEQENISKGPNSLITKEELYKNHSSFIQIRDMSKWVIGKDLLQT